jgi:ubiquinone biosynthesis protein
VIDLLESVLAGLELAAYEASDLLDDAQDLWQTVEEGASNLGHDFQDLGRELSWWPARFARVSSSAWVLAQITTSYRFHEATAGFRSIDGAAGALEALHARNARRFYEASLSNGGAFLKVGQLLSSRMDLLPAPWIRELSQLQDAVPAAPFEAVRPMIEVDLEGTIPDVFASFDEEPVAAASIGQVHRAVTHDGVVAAVKVQRPGIRELIELDLSLFESSLAGIRSILPPTDYETIVEEVRTMVIGELDYANEARMMSRIADFFEGHPGIIVPRPIEGLVGDRVFGSEFIEGRKITSVLDDLWVEREAGDAEAGRRIDRVLGLVLECYLRQILEAGVFQADPHPGNLLVTASDKLVLLDFGCTKPMPARTRGIYLGIFQSFLARDRNRMAALFADLGFETASGRPETLHVFSDALLAGFENALDGEGFEWPTEEQLFERAAELLEVAHEDPVVRLPAEFVMLGRVLGTLGGLFHHYRPNLDVAEHLLPSVSAAMSGFAENA